MKTDPICGMTVEEKDAVVAEINGQVYHFCSAGCLERYLGEQAHPASRKKYDLLIIGGGPAGLTAAVYAATLRMNACLISKELGGQATDSTKIENYMGFDFITGPELIAKFQHQLIHSHYIDHHMSEVEAIEPQREEFLARTGTGQNYVARCLIVATGMTRRRLGVPGEEEFQRRGIFYGSIPDLSFVQEEEVAVIGGGNTALQIVENLQAVARRIHLVFPGELKADPAVVERVRRFENLTLHQGYLPLQFEGERTLSQIMIRRKDGEQTIALPVKGAFVAIGLQPNSARVSHLVRLNARNEILIGPDCSTSCRGIFAAGDVSSAFGKRIVIASGEGAKAAIAAREYLLSLKKEG